MIAVCVFITVIPLKRGLTALRLTAGCGNGSRTQYRTGYEPGMINPFHSPAMVGQIRIELISLVL